MFPKGISSSARNRPFTPESAREVRRDRIKIMPVTFTRSAVIRAITSCVPANKFDNLADSTEFNKEEVEKVVGINLQQ